MSTHPSIISVTNKLNETFPGINLNSDLFSGYFIKTLEITECLTTIKPVKKLTQYHIAITGKEKNMTLFPLITSFQYMSNAETKFKRKFTFDCPVTLYVKNLIKHVTYIIENYDKIQKDFEAIGKFKAQKEVYEALLKSYNENKNETIETRTTVAYNKRQKSGQEQIEIGHSTDGNDFLNFRKLTVPKVHLIILKRESKAQYTMLLVTDEDFTKFKYGELPILVEANDSNNSILTAANYEGNIQVEEDLNSDEENENVEETVNQKNHYLHKFADELITNQEIALNLNDSYGGLNIGDIIWLYCELNGALYLTKVSEVTKVEKKENGTIDVIIGILKEFIPPINIDELIEKGVIPVDAIEKIQKGAE